MHILLIEDDLDLGASLVAALKLHGFSCQWLRRPAEAPARLADSLADCVLLDLNLPGDDGLALLARWRGAGEALPVIVITARTALQDRLAGLDGGADDFLVKPFAAEELLSRIRAVVRRAAHQASERWTLGPLVIDPRPLAAPLAGRPGAGAPRGSPRGVERARDPGAVVPKSQLAQRLDPLGDPLHHAAIEMHVFNLRKKLGPERIRTVRGVGYALVAA